MHGKLWLAIALSPALMASTCVEPVRVQVGPPDLPAFQFTCRADVLIRVEMFEVRTCPQEGNRVVWRLERDSAPPTISDPLRIVYGRVPRGYREGRPAGPLQPGGCYQTGAYVVDQHPLPRSNLGGATFRVLPRRQLVVGWPAGLGISSRPFRQINRAAVACERRYRNARTDADRAGVRG